MKKPILFLIFIFFIITTLGYYHRFPTGDDAWFAEQAFWLQKLGYIKSEFFHGYLKWDYHFLASHKLFLLFGAISIYVFGFSLLHIQMISLIAYIILIYVIYKYLKSRQVQPNFLLLALLLILSNRLLMKMSFEFRPELIMCTFGFASFYLLDSKRHLNVIISGTLAGLALLCHLNGIIYLIAGFLTLFLIKEYKKLILFAISGGITSALYFYDVAKYKAWDLWIYQFKNDPATQNAFDISKKLMVILKYPKIFVESPEELVLTLLLLGCIINFRNSLNKLPSKLIKYLIILFVAFGLITKSPTSLYQMLFLPFMIVLIIEILSINNYHSVKKMPLNILFTLYFIVGLIGGIRIINKNLKKTYAPELNNSIAQLLPPNSSGIVNMPFIFNDFSKFKWLRCYELFRFSQILIGSPVTTEAFFKWVKTINPDFIIINYDIKTESYLPKPNEEIPNYSLKYFIENTAVYVAHELDSKN